MNKDLATGAAALVFGLLLFLVGLVGVLGWGGLGRGDLSLLLLLLGGIIALGGGIYLVQGQQEAKMTARELSQPTLGQDPAKAQTTLSQLSAWLGVTGHTQFTVRDLKAGSGPSSSSLKMFYGRGIGLIPIPVNHAVQKTYGVFDDGGQEIFRFSPCVSSSTNPPPKELAHLGDLQFALLRGEEVGAVVFDRVYPDATQVHTLVGAGWTPCLEFRTDPRLVSGDKLTGGFPGGPVSWKSSADAVTDNLKVTDATGRTVLARVHTQQFTTHDTYQVKSEPGVDPLVPLTIAHILRPGVVGV